MKNHMKALCKQIPGIVLTLLAAAMVFTSPFLTRTAEATGMGNIIAYEGGKGTAV